MEKKASAKLEKALGRLGSHKGSLGKLWDRSIALGWSLEWKKRKMQVSQKGVGFKRRCVVLLVGKVSAREDDGAVSSVRVGRGPALAGRVSGEGTEASAGAGTGEDDEVVVAGGRWRR